MLTDNSLDAVPIPASDFGPHGTVAALVMGVGERVPSADAITAAAMALRAPSPAMLASHAQWSGLLGQLGQVLTPVEILWVLTRCCERAYRVWGPDGGLVLAAVDRAGLVGRGWALEICAAVIDARGSDATLFSNLRELACCAGTLLLGEAPPAGSPSPTELLGLVSLNTTPEAMRRLFLAAPPSERAAWLHDFLDIAGLLERSGARAPRIITTRLDRLTPILDRCAEGAPRAEIKAALAACAADHALQERVLAQLDSTATPEPRPTPRALEAEAYVLAKYAEQLRAGMLPSLVEAAAPRSVSLSCAPELASVSSWAAASGSRREAIAAGVAQALGREFAPESLQPFAGASWPVAMFRHKPSGLRFSLVPGGAFDMGLSQREEQLIRQHAESLAGVERFSDEVGNLLEDLEVMRPVRRVAIQPFLACQQPLGTSQLRFLAGRSKSVRNKRALQQPAVADLGVIADILESSPFRLLSEAEWEYASRGGTEAELTWRGHLLPDEAFMASVADLPPDDAANAFGLAAFGLFPELCADAWCADEGAGAYADAPVDGTPRLGSGPRVVRGGAWMLSPWQACGEWQLLCNAVRGTQQAWDHRPALRLALGVSL
jgi:formylglycine-generating enzyme required for sulfatase activity